MDIIELLTLKQPMAFPIVLDLGVMTTKEVLGLARLCDYLNWVVRIPALELKAFGTPLDSWYQGKITWEVNHADAV